MVRGDWSSASPALINTLHVSLPGRPIKTRRNETFSCLSSTVLLPALLLAMITATSAVILPAVGGVDVLNITRHEDGDYFFVTGVECGVTQCMEVSGGSALSDRPPGAPPPCACRCPLKKPLFREDRLTCVDDIQECPLAEFGSGVGSSRVPFVFLPLNGQIIHPSKDIIFPEIQKSICAISSSQFLTRTGWSSLKNDVDNDVPLSLYRDEGRTFLQWRGSENTRAKASGRAVLARLSCRTGVSIFNPCVAFRVQGSPPDVPPDVSEVWFSRDEPTSSSIGGVAERGASSSDTGGGESSGETTSGSSAGAAMSFCALVAALAYFGALLVYFRSRKSIIKNGGDLETESVAFDDAPSLSNTKTNPLLSMEPYMSSDGFPAKGDSTSFLSETSSKTSSEQLSDDKSIYNSDRMGQLDVMESEVSSAIVTVHRPSKRDISHPYLQQQISTKSSSYAQTVSHATQTVLERIPEQHVSIVEREGDCGSPSPTPPAPAPPGSLRRKLYFNPAFFEVQLLKVPPPAAVEFLTKIREVIAIAKEKMLSKRFIPTLPSIPEELSCHTSESDLSFPYESISKNYTSYSLKRENSRRKKYCNGCPGCSSMKFHRTYLKTLSEKEFCKSCISSEFKQDIVRKWLEEVPVMESSSKNSLKDCNMLLGNIKDKYESIERQKSSLNDEEKCIKESENVITYDKISIKVTNNVKRRNKMHAPPPPVLKKEELDNFNISKLNEDQLIDAKKKEDDRPVIPPELKQKMNAVINELAKFRRIDPILPRSSSPVSEVVTPFIPKMVVSVTPKFVVPSPVKYDPYKMFELKKTLEEKRVAQYENVKFPGQFEVDSLERTTTKRRASLSNVNFGSIRLNDFERGHKRRSSIVAMEELEPMKKIHEMNSRLSKSYQGLNVTDLTREDLSYGISNNMNSAAKCENYSIQRTNLVSEVYVNDFVNTVSSASDSDYSVSSQTLKVKYAEPVTKPGQLVIEVDNPPEVNRVPIVDNFDPDTLDRKPGKLKLANETNMSPTKQMPIERLFLKSSGSFKSKTVSNLNLNNSTPHVTVTHSPEKINKIGSLREIYEAKNRNNKKETSDFSPNGLFATFGNNLSIDDRSLDYCKTMSNRQEIESSSINSFPKLNSLFLNSYLNDDFKPPLPPKKNLKSKKDLTWSGRNFFSELHGSSTEISEGNSEDSRSTGSSMKFRITRSEPYSTHQHATYKINKPKINPALLKSSSRNNTDDKVYTTFGSMSMGYTYEDPDKNFFHSLDPNYENYSSANYSANSNTYTKPSDTYDKSKILKISDKIAFAPNMRRIIRRSNNEYRTKREKIRKSHKTEDSGYLSSDSNDSRHGSKYILQIKDNDDLVEEVVSETELESTGDARSESGGESIETNSVFFGSFRRLQFANRDKLNDIDGIRSDSSRNGDSSKADDEREHRGIISIVSPHGRLLALDNL